MNEAADRDAPAPPLSVGGDVEPRRTSAAPHGGADFDAADWLRLAVVPAGDWGSQTLWQAIGLVVFGVLCGAGAGMTGVAAWWLVLGLMSGPGGRWGVLGGVCLGGLGVGLTVASGRTILPTVRSLARLRLARHVRIAWKPTVLQLRVPSDQIHSVGTMSVTEAIEHAIAASDHPSGWPRLATLDLPREQVHAIGRAQTLDLRAFPTSIWKWGGLATLSEASLWGSTYWLGLERSPGRQEVVRLPPGVMPYKLHRLLTQMARAWEVPIQTSRATRWPAKRPRPFGAARFPTAWQPTPSTAPIEPQAPAGSVRPATPVDPPRSEAVEDGSVFGSRSGHTIATGAEPTTALLNVERDVDENPYASPQIVPGETLAGPWGERVMRVPTSAWDYHVGMGVLIVGVALVTLLIGGVGAARVFEVGVKDGALGCVMVYGLVAAIVVGLVGRGLRSTVTLYQKGLRFPSKPALPWDEIVSLTWLTAPTDPARGECPLSALVIENRRDRDVEVIVCPPGSVYERFARTLWEEVAPPSVPRRIPGHPAQTTDPTWASEPP